MSNYYIKQLFINFNGDKDDLEKELDKLKKVFSLVSGYSNDVFYIRNVIIKNFDQYKDYSKFYLKNITIINDKPGIEYKPFFYFMDSKTRIYKEDIGYDWKFTLILIYILIFLLVSIIIFFTYSYIYNIDIIKYTSNLII